MTVDRVLNWVANVSILLGATLIGIGVYRLTQDKPTYLNAIHCISPLTQPRTVTLVGKVYRTGNYYTAADGFLFIPMPGDVCKIHPILRPLEPEQHQGETTYE